MTFDWGPFEETARGVIARMDRLLAGEDINWTELDEIVSELEALVARRALVRSRWNKLKQHQHFKETGDWADIVRSDWPSVRRVLLSPPETPT